jgi:hypothetical protein
VGSKKLRPLREPEFIRFRDLYAPPEHVALQRYVEHGGETGPNAAKYGAALILVLFGVGVLTFVASIVSS